MVKKQKKRARARVKKKTPDKTNNYYRWIAVGVVIFVLILINIAGRNNPAVRSVFKKFIPVATPTPTIAVRIITPDKLNTDQAVYIKMATEDLAAKLGVKTEDIKITDVAQKEWNDTSLGCPEKNKLYLQVVTSGYIIKLKASGSSYRYNAGLNRVVSCQGS